jgi:hypothetical protein
VRTAMLNRGQYVLYGQKQMCLPWLPATLQMVRHGYPRTNIVIVTIMRVCRFERCSKKVPSSYVGRVHEVYLESSWPSVIGSKVRR